MVYDPFWTESNLETLDYLQERVGNYDSSTGYEGSLDVELFGLNGERRGNTETVVRRINTIAALSGITTFRAIDDLVSPDTNPAQIVSGLNKTTTPFFLDILGNPLAFTINGKR